MRWPSIQARPESVMGHSRPGRTGSKSSHVRYVPKATDNRLRTACSDGLKANSCTAKNFHQHLPAARSRELGHGRRYCGVLSFSAFPEHVTPLEGPSGEKRRKAKVYCRSRRRSGRLAACRARMSALCQKRTCDLNNARLFLCHSAALAICRPVCARRSKRRAPADSAPADRRS